MLNPQDREKLEAAQQAIDLARQSLLDLYVCDNPLLSEIAWGLIEATTATQRKLERLLAITKTEGGE